MFKVPPRPRTLVLIGIATPPMGIGLYTMVEVGKVSFERVTVAVLPFLIPLILVPILITYVPALTSRLPDLIMGLGSRTGSQRAPPDPRSDGRRRGAAGRCEGLDLPRPNIH
jgi:hypothetical protein